MPNPLTTIHHPDLRRQWTGPKTAANALIEHGGWKSGPQPKPDEQVSPTAPRSRVAPDITSTASTIKKES